MWSVNYYIYTIVALNLAFPNWYGKPFGTYVWSTPEPLLATLKMLEPIPDRYEIELSA